MAEAKHTPGPWEAGGATGGDEFHVYCNDATGQAVAQCDQEFTFFSREERIANVRLIAAAPDLLAELREARTVILDLKNARWSEVEASDEEMVRSIDAAIAKATGTAS